MPVISTNIAANSAARYLNINSSEQTSSLSKLASDYLDLQGGVIVIVGPKAKIEPQLQKVGITKTESATPEGD